MSIPLVDCRGMACPLPIIQVRLRLNVSKKGDQLRIYADDETFEHEILRFCQLADMKLLDIEEQTQESKPFVSYLIEVLK